MQRRDFLASLGAAAVAFPASTADLAGRPRTKTILVLGGTNFVGPAVVSEAERRGHEVTLFNRGITRPELFPGVEKLRGVRAPGGSDLRSLGRSRRWDAVIDVWPADRALVRETAALLRERTDFYFYVSSIAVYADFSTPGLNEGDRVVGGPAADYGAEKAASEEAVRSAFPEAHGIARCHAIVGPYDPSPTYHYWLRRLATYDEVMCPGSGDDPVQAVDVRDLARWVLDCIDEGRSGTHNVTGPWPPRRMRDLLEASAAGVRSGATLTWVDADVLRRDHDVRSFSDMPLWAPLVVVVGFYLIVGRAAIAAGASYRPVEETAADSWRWFRSHFFSDVRFPYQGTGISREREEGILDAWRRRAKGAPPG